MKKYAILAAAAVMLAMATPASAETRFSGGTNGEDFRIGAERPVAVGGVSGVRVGVEGIRLDDADTNLFGVTAGKDFTVPYLPRTTAQLIVGAGHADTEQDSGLALSYGLAVDYGIDEQWSVGVEWRRISGDVRVSKRADLDEDVALIRVAYRR